MTRPVTVLVASDGSPPARAAVSLAAHLPWPDDTRAVGVVAAATAPAIGLGRIYRQALAQSYRGEAERLARVLRARFSESAVTLVDKDPVDAILAEQRRRRADVIVVGCRGLGMLGRVPLGSVSRRLARRAPCAVLVSKGVSHPPRRFMIAVDGSAESVRGVRFIERLKAGDSARVRLIAVVPPIPLPMMGRAPASVRAEVTRHVTRERSRREESARSHLDQAAARLRNAGWNVTSEVRRGAPLVELLKVASSWRAGVVVCGARSTSGLNRLLLGSVADGLLSRSPVSVLIAH